MRTIRRQAKATSLDHAIELAKQHAKEQHRPSKVMADLMGVQKAGSLLNMPSAYNSDNELASHQIYIPFDADEVWRRGKRNGGNWTEWSKLTVSPADLSAAIESSVPSGTVFHFAGQTAPAGWLKANGAAVSRTAYAALFAAIGTTYGAGDGRSTFNLPDLRGEFIRGWDDGRGIDRGRALGSPAKNVTF